MPIQLISRFREGTDKRPTFGHLWLDSSKGFRLVRSDVREHVVPMDQNLTPISGIVHPDRWTALGEAKDWLHGETDRRDYAYHWWLGWRHREPETLADYYALIYGRLHGNHETFEFRDGRYVIAYDVSHEAGLFRVQLEHDGERWRYQDYPESDLVAAWTGRRYLREFRREGHMVWCRDDIPPGLKARDDVDRWERRKREYVFLDPAGRPVFFTKPGGPYHAFSLFRGDPDREYSEQYDWMGYCECLNDLLRRLGLDPVAAGETHVPPIDQACDEDEEYRGAAVQLALF